MSTTSTQGLEDAAFFVADQIVATKRAREFPDWEACVKSLKTTLADRVAHLLHALVDYDADGNVDDHRSQSFLQRLIDEHGVDINGIELRDACVNITDPTNRACRVLFSHPNFHVGAALTAIAYAPIKDNSITRYGRAVFRAAQMYPLPARFGPCVTGDPELLSHFSVILYKRNTEQIWTPRSDFQELHRELVAIEPLRQLVTRTLRATEMQTTVLWPSILPVVFAYLLPKPSDVIHALDICRDKLHADEIRDNQLRVAWALDVPEPARPAAAAAAAVAAVGAPAPRRFSARLRARASVTVAAAAVVVAPALAGRKRKSTSAAAAGGGRAAKLPRSS
jgi:hypothetical protein